MSELIQQFEKEFEKVRKELGFKASLNELDDIFFLRDYIQKEGYVSNKLSRQVARRIVDLYVLWAQYLHGILMPNPGSLVNVIESQVFNEDEREEITKILDILMSASADSNIIGMTKDKSKEKDFIDDSLKMWNELNPKLVKILKKISEKWKERAKSKPEKSNKDFRKMYG